MRSWIAQGRVDPDQYATMLWERSFLNPSAAMTEVANAATRWSAELVMSVARTEALLATMVARGESQVPVLSTARTVARALADRELIESRGRNQRNTMKLIRHIRFLTLVLDHSTLGRDDELGEILSVGLFLDRTISSALAVGRSASFMPDTPSAADETVQRWRRMIEAALDARRLRDVSIAHLSSAGGLNASALRDAIALISSPRLRAREAVEIADILLQSGSHVRESFHGLLGPIARPSDCITREWLRAQSQWARGVGTIADHWVLILALLARVGLQSEEGIAVLGHCWRIEPETLLDDFEPSQLLVLSTSVWRRLVDNALQSADDLSLDLVEQLHGLHPDRVPEAARLREIAQIHMRHRSSTCRAKGLRILELIATLEDGS